MNQNTSHRRTAYKWAKNIARMDFNPGQTASGYLVFNHQLVSGIDTENPAAFLHGPSHTWPKQVKHLFCAGDYFYACATFTKASAYFDRTMESRGSDRAKPMPILSLERVFESAETTNLLQPRAHRRAGLPVCQVGNEFMSCQRICSSTEDLVSEKLPVHIEPALICKSSATNTSAPVTERVRTSVQFAMGWAS